MATPALEILKALSWLQLFLAVLTLVTVYCILDYAYLFFFHPLAKFPGPRLAAISHTWYAYHWMAGRYPWDIEQLHKKFGPVVRIAPNELSFSSAQSYVDIYGHATKDHKTFIKGSFYDHGQPEAGVVAERNAEKHRTTRKALSHGFSAQALKSQDDVLDQYVKLFVSQLSEMTTGRRSVNMKEWYNWLTFDIIGELAFGESFGAVGSAKAHFWIETIHEGAFLVCLFEIGRRLPLAWPFILFALPSGIKRKFDTFLEYSAAQVKKRVGRQHEVTRHDFFASLLADKSAERGFSEEWLIAQANVLIIAGSDTTATALTSITYFLCKYPEKLRELQAEIRGLFMNSSEIDSNTVQKSPYLAAVIEEGLRMFPPTAFGLPRISPGAEVSGVYVPKGTVVSTSSWTATHSPQHFHNARTFLPERWLPIDDPRYSHSFDNDVKLAARPFSLGPRGCLGINLAYLEMRKVLAKLVWHFDWALVNANQVEWERDARFEGFWQLPAPRVTFTPVSRDIEG